jgi:hypothetical protein
MYDIYYVFIIYFKLITLKMINIIIIKKRQRKKKKKKDFKALTINIWLVYSTDIE